MTQMHNKTAPWFYRLIVIVTILALPACSASDSFSQLSAQVIESHRLESQLNETSGLVCTADTAITLNDSGNEAALYRIDAKGHIQHHQLLSFDNHDFEAVTADDEFFYIGDIGNNRGQRPYVYIQQVSRSNFKKQQTLKITYTGNVPGQNRPYAHDYDAEALVSRDDHLLLFSKSWATEKVKVYRIAKDNKNQTVEPVAQIEGLPGLVTGVDWDVANQRYVLVGYEPSPIGLFEAFVAVVTPDFTIEGVARLDQFAQVEGVCVKDASHIWLTQESTPLDSARLGVVQLSQ